MGLLELPEGVHSNTLRVKMSVWSPAQGAQQANSFRRMQVFPNLSTSVQPECADKGACQLLWQTVSMTSSLLWPNPAF